jgi:hypothetical protein
MGGVASVLATNPFCYPTGYQKASKGETNRIGEVQRRKSRGEYREKTLELCRFYHWAAIVQAINFMLLARWAARVAYVGCRCTRE